MIMFSQLILAILSGSLAVQAATVPQYGQCGGSGYTGSTTCDTGLKCYCQNQCTCTQYQPGLGEVTNRVHASRLL